MRAASAAWWERQRVEGAWARGDESVRRAAEKLGKGIEEHGEGTAGRMRGKVREILRQMLEAVGLPVPPAGGAQ